MLRIITWAVVCHLSLTCPSLSPGIIQSILMKFCFPRLSKTEQCVCATYVPPSQVSNQVHWNCSSTPMITHSFATLSIHSTCMASLQDTAHRFSIRRHPPHELLTPASCQLVPQRCQRLITSAIVTWRCYRKLILYLRELHISIALL